MLGKTTLAYYLGEKHKIKVWYVDVFVQKYIDNATAKTPYMYEWKNEEMVDIFQKESNTLFEEYIAFYEEALPLLIKDLENSNTENLILEGTEFLCQCTRRRTIKIFY